MISIYYIADQVFVTLTYCAQCDRINVNQKICGRNPSFLLLLGDPVLISGIGNLMVCVVEI